MVVSEGMLLATATIVASKHTTVHCLPVPILSNASSEAPKPVNPASTSAPKETVDILLALSASLITTQQPMSL